MEGRQKGEEFRKVFPAVELFRPAAGKTGGMDSGGFKLPVAPSRLAHRRVEKNQGRITAGPVRGKEGHQCRQGVKDARLGLFPELPVNGVHDQVMVGGQGGNVVVIERRNPVPTVVPHIVNEQVEFFGKERPERVVEVYGQAVAVAEHQPGPVRVAVPPHDNAGFRVHRNFVHRNGLWQLPVGFRFFSQFSHLCHDYFRVREIWHLATIFPMSLSPPS